MTDYSQRFSDSWSERMRLIRFRRKREKLRFWDEFKLVPRWLIWTVFGLYLIALSTAVFVNLHPAINQGHVVPEDLAENPELASLALAGVITVISIVVATPILLTGYVNRDARRRGMNPALWTFLVLVMLPGYLVLGFIVYFLMREPLPYPCPQCAATVGARFNFCPNCRCNLYPTCPQCKRDVVEGDKYCIHCGQELGAVAAELPTAR